MREGWELKTLGDVCSALNGYAFKSKDTIEKSNTQLLRMGNLYQNKLDLERKPVFYPDNFVDDYADYILVENDLIMSLTGTVDKTDYGYTVRVEPSKVKLLLNQRIMKITVLDKQELDNKYLHSFLLSPDFLESLYATANGTRQANLSSKTILTLDIPIPPLPEQTQIVNTLDKAFKQIDQAKENLEKNLHNAKELFQSKLNEVFSQRGEGWEEKNIENISTVVNGYSFKSIDFSSENEIKSIKITNVGIMEFVEDLSNNLPSDFLEKYSKVKVSEGSLVLALTRTIISSGLKVARIPKNYHNALLNQRVAAIIPNNNIVNSDYLYYYFSSNIVYNYVLDNVNTLMQPNLSILDLKKMSVPITSLEKQKSIVEILNKLNKNIIEVQTHYQQKLNNLEELKKSILQKAFRGELL